MKKSKGYQFFVWEKVCEAFLTKYWNLLKAPKTVKFERLFRILHIFMTETFLDYFWKNSMLDILQGP